MRPVWIGNHDIAAARLIEAGEESHTVELLREILSQEQVEGESPEEYPEGNIGGLEKRRGGRCR